jgi:cell wall-associated NlpC family hydrolase
MQKKIYLILVLVLLAIVPMSAAKRNTHTKKAKTTKVTTAKASAAKAVADDDMKLAAVSKTNPFEIVPAAGMEILGDINDPAGDYAMVEDMLKYARKFMGVRYVSGGRSPKGFDCSGFTSYVYNQFGYKLSASSSDQYNQGSKVSRSEIQPGDLLFFTGRASKSGRVGHVAIAVDSDPVSGEVTFIHAARTGIQIDRMSAPYYSARYLGARRVIGK